MKTTTYSSIMTSILQERKVGAFRLKKRVIPAGKLLQHYVPEEGKMVIGKFVADFPIVVLKEGNSVWMSDSPFEFEGIAGAVKRSHGRVLTSGLGIGLFATLAAKKRNVKKIDIVERSPEVIQLIFDQLPGAKLEIINDDLYNFLSTTSRRYDFIFLDIWADILGPIGDADKATEAAKRCLEPGGEIRVWLQELIDRVKDLLPKGPIIGSGFRIHEPCLVCGKTFRNDYAGLCCDCADSLGVSELFLKKRDK